MRSFFATADEVKAGLTAFAKEHRPGASHITGIGAFSNARHLRRQFDPESGLALVCV